VTTTKQSAREEQSSEYRVEVELDIFSGRPNPKWTLHPGEIRILEEKLQELSGGILREESQQLGYRGFRVVLSNGPPGFPEHILVNDSYINAKGPGYFVGCQDTEGLEKWLIQIAKERGYGKIIQEGRLGKRLDN